MSTDFRATSAQSGASRSPRHRHKTLIFSSSTERLATNTITMRLPATVDDYMDKVNEKIGTDYKPFNYYGAPDAEELIIAMGSVCDTIRGNELISLTARGEKTGMVL